MKGSGVAGTIQGSGDVSNMAATLSKKTATTKKTARTPAADKPAAAGSGKAKKTAAVKKGQGARAEKAAKAAPSGTLVIVESPAKAKTIEKYLGSKYTVLASMGHLIDLPKSRLGVDTEKNFEPEYMTIRGKASLLKDLHKAAKKAKHVLLASDPDREGEAIAFQIGKYLQDKIPGLSCERIIFNEITPFAIKEAVKHPRGLDIPKVDAQKARRVLDRLVGYNLSPLLWKKVKNGLSAGRVQSVALRLICDREREVESFIPVEYWSLDAEFKKGRVGFSAELALYRGSKPELNKEGDVLAIVKAIEGVDAIVSEVKESERILKPKPPFTTSKLQQTAANRLGFTSKKTMQLAQQLYEGVNVGSTRIGLITYMRTDSTRISAGAVEEVRAWIAKEHPQALPASPNFYASDAKAQDAHEAIRPTTVGYVPDAIKESLTKDQYKLYALIWERFVASQMSVARMSVTGADILIGEALFRTTTSRLVEKGFFAVLKVGVAREDKEAHAAPPLAPGEKLKVEGLKPEQHFTQGSSRFTDASIIKAMEEGGIGRPSTYAPTISVLLERYYVTRETRQLVPTTLGRMINDILVESFPTVVESGFTAYMETKLDEVDESRADWVKVIGDFYAPFKKRVDEIMDSLASYRGTLDESTDIVCEKCGKPMVKKLGRFGFFLACTGFPECRNTRSVPVAICPKCGGDVVARRKARGAGREFFGCDRYPDCDFITYDKPTGAPCPKCGWPLVEKVDRKTGGHKACINPDCDYLHFQTDEDEHGPED